jgi:hypothetical protein
MLPTTVGASRATDKLRGMHCHLLNNRVLAEGHELSLPGSLAAKLAASIDHFHL